MEKIKTSWELQNVLISRINLFLDDEREDIKHGRVSRDDVFDSVGQRAQGNFTCMYPEFWSELEEWFGDMLEMKIKDAFLASK